MNCKQRQQNTRHRRSSLKILCILCLILSFHGFLAAPIEETRSPRRRRCVVLSFCNIASTVNECRSCGMTCMTSGGHSTGLCFPSNSMEDAFDEERDLQYDF